MKLSSLKFWGKSKKERTVDVGSLKFQVKIDWSQEECNYFLNNHIDEYRKVMDKLGDVVHNKDKNRKNQDFRLTWMTFGKNQKLDWKFRETNPDQKRRLYNSRQQLCNFLIYCRLQNINIPKEISDIVDTLFTTFKKINGLSQYDKCLQCNFVIERQQKYCPNCGFYKNLSQQSSEYLQLYEQTIQGRLSEIMAWRQKTQILLQESLRENDLPQNNVTVETLKKVLSIQNEQSDLYTMKLWDIKIIQWYNALIPFIDNSDSLNYEEYEFRIKRLTHIKSKGEDLLKALKKTTFSALDKQPIIIQLQDCLNICHQIYQDFRARQAANLAHDVSSFKKKVKEPSNIQTNPIEHTALLQAFSDIGGFSSGFKKLEDEYFRLKAEEELY